MLSLRPGSWNSEAFAHTSPRFSFLRVTKVRSERKDLMIAETISLSVVNELFEFPPSYIRQYQRANLDLRPVAHDAAPSQPSKLSSRAGDNPLAAIGNTTARGRLPGGPRYAIPLTTGCTMALVSWATTARCRHRSQREPPGPDSRI